MQTSCSRTGFREPISRNARSNGYVRVDVPVHDHHPLLQEREFFGDYKLTEEGALESENVAALLYLQKSGIIYVDDINSSELTSCQVELANYQHKLLAASSWAIMF